MTTTQDEAMGEFVPPTEEHPAAVQVSVSMSTVWGGVGAPHTKLIGQGTALSGACIPDPVQGTASC